MEKMSIDRVYIEAAIETLDLVHQISNHLQSNQQTGEMNNFLSQILVIRLHNPPQECP